MVGRGHFVRRTNLILLYLIQGRDLELNGNSLLALLLLMKISPIVFNEYLCHMSYKLIFRKE